VPNWEYTEIYVENNLWTDSSGAVTSLDRVKPSGWKRDGYLSMTEPLNRLGGQGWELIAVWPLGTDPRDCRLIFKRLKE
jgi:hypothetical protein